MVHLRTEAASRNIKSHFQKGNSITMLRQKIIACATALFCCGLSVVETASAGAVGTCTLTGYAFMGCSGAYVGTPGGSNPKDYFLGQPLYHEFNGDNMGGFGWAKFAVGTAIVDSAYLIYDLVGVGSMSVDPPTPEYPAYLDLYTPGDIDVADLPGEYGEYGDDGFILCQTLQDNLRNSGVPLSIVMAHNGTYCVDITDLYNGWVAGTIDNHGLVFSAPDDMGGNAGRYASFGNSSGDAPSITSVLSGDANLDGSVNGTDLNAVLSNYNTTFTCHAWAFGDFNGDGSVNGTDLNAVLSNYNQSVHATAGVPEPSTGLLVGAALMGLGLARILRHRRTMFCPSFSPFGSRSVRS